MANYVIDKIKKELLPKFPGVDDVIAAHAGIPLCDGMNAGTAVPKLTSFRSRRGRIWKRPETGLGMVKRA
jgi:hypothetical protein